MENIKKIFPRIREIKDDKQVVVVRVIFNGETPFDVDEQNEIANIIEKQYKNYIFTGEKIDIMCGKDGITSYLLYYKNKKRPC